MRYLLGSIVPVKYPWDEYIDKERRIIALRNYVASDDWVVAVFGRFFEAICDMFNIGTDYFREIGSSGFNGFAANSAHRFEIRFVRGGHSAALTKDHYESIANFILNVDTEVSPETLKSKQSPLTVWCSKFSVFLVSMVIALIGTAFLIFYDFSWIAGLIYILMVYTFLLFF